MEAKSRSVLASSLPAGAPSAVLLSPLDVIHASQMPILIFYASAPPGAEERIESGLVSVLDHYPELAGRIGKDHLGRHCIHLSNEGAVLVVAKSSETVAEFLDKRGNDNLVELVASSTLALGDAANQIPLIIQLTRFACDGLVISWEGHHRVCDGTAHANFLLQWASCAKTGFTTPNFVPLLHDRSLLFSKAAAEAALDPQAKFIYESMTSRVAPEQELLTLSVSFTSKKLQDLKSVCENKFTTYETLSAHLWRSMTSARGIHPSVRVGLFCPANGRAIIKAPQGFFGNATFHCFAQATAKELLDNSLAFAASIVKESIKRCSNTVFIESVVEFLAAKQESEQQESDSAPVQSKDTTWEPNVMVASWSRFPFYEVDFGFGDPVRFSTANVGTEGVFTIGPPRKDGTMEVFVNARKHQARALLGLLDSNQLV